MNIIETRNLSFSYKDNKKALSNININIEKGRVTAILGGNGAGKSTLFLNLNGVYTPDSGEIYFDGKKVTYGKKELNELRRRVGIVFQDPNDQLFSASVRNDIAFGAVNMGLPDDAVEKMVEEIAVKTGISDFLDSPTHALSFGQKKRVAIAGVLIMRPDVIILDEPTAGLDPAGVSEILRLLIEVKEAYNVSVIISTHDIDIIPLYCDYAYVLHLGEVVLSGTPKEVFGKAPELRSFSLRIPRIAHLMEILSTEDNLDVDITASTISQARASIIKLFN